MAADAMAKLFITLKHLVRLDLSNNRLKSKLRQVLMRLDTPLQYLRVAGCGLATTDLTYLSMSHHTAGLTELDISENGLGSSIGVVLHLLRSIRSRVCVLELEDSAISDSHLESLNITFRNLTSLLYLNISGNSFQSEKVLQVAEAIAGLQDLQYICMSYPRDCYLPDSDEEQEQRKKDFVTNFGEVIHREQERLGIAHRVPSTVLSELDQDMEVVGVNAN
jgi:Leucine-rich repeat (LRR) protein